MRQSLTRVGRALLLLAVLAAVTGSSTALVYDITALGAGRARAVNEAGVVVGELGSQPHAFVWTSARGTIDVHDLLGLESATSVGVDINARGEVLVGAGEQSFLVRLDHNGEASIVAELPDHFFPVAISDTSSALGGEMPAAVWSRHDGLEMVANLANSSDLNNRGQILGTTSAAWDPSLPAGINVVVVEKDGSLNPLGSYISNPGYPATVVRPGEISDRGTAVYSVATYQGPGYPTELTGFRWDPSGHGSKVDDVWLAAINDVGTMVGATADQRPVVVDRLGRSTLLPMPDGYATGSAEEITNNGLVVGYVSGFGLPSLAVMWQPVH